MVRITFLKNFCLVFMLLLLLGTAGYAQMVYRSDNLSSNRYNAMPNDILQITIMYDGVPSPNTQVRIRCIHYITQETAYIYINNFPDFGTGITTKEYICKGFYPDGEVYVSNVVPNGVIDGIAVGLFWKDVNGRYKIARSNNALYAVGSSGAEFVGSWPYAFDTMYFYNKMPQVTDSFARYQAIASLIGAKVFGNGYHYVR